jgi:hypothetical protein
MCFHHRPDWKARDHAIGHHDHDHDHDHEAGEGRDGDRGTGRNKALHKHSLMSSLFLCHREMWTADFDPKRSSALLENMP